jgi:hypothetical protein
MPAFLLQEDGGEARVIDLTPEQMGMLKEILTDYLSELRMEIADTDSMEFREGLKRRREFVQELVERLAREQSAVR